jgi:lambda family phage portal protein
MTKAKVSLAKMDTPALTEQALGGGLEGAERTSRETFSWNPAVISPDRQLNPVKDMADARARDMVQNDGYAMGAVHTHRDSIVGSQFRLNAQPDYELLGADEAWSIEFQRIVESRFNLMADSQECWFDAARSNTLTGLIRLGVGGFLMTGEVLATAEWLSKDKGRPFSTAIQMVSPTRLSNPDGLADDKFLRRGVARDLFGRPIGYHIRVAYPSDMFDFSDTLRWRYVPAAKPWGRKQVIHIIEQLQPDQTRGIADMVSVLKQMRMTKKFSDVVLQNAVVNATYAAAVESELPKEMVYGAMGAGQAGFAEMLGQYMTALSDYTNGSTNIAIDGVKMPHLFPGTKLSLKPMGTPGGVGSEFEESLLRHIASPLGLSYEQLSRDYSKTNYSSARASMSETWKFMQGRKKSVADRMATSIYILWLEEEINAGNIPLPKGMGSEIFYDPVKREALCACDWIGASRGQIDELKETQAAVMRINSGLSTYEKECARLGEDFRKIFRQRSRENKLMKDLDLTFTSDAQKPGSNTAQQTMKEDKAAVADQGAE